MIFLPGFSTWLSLSKRPKCKRHNWPAIVIAMDGYGSTRCPSRWYHGNLVPKPTSTTKSKSKLGTKHICGAQKNKTKHKSCEWVWVQRRRETEIFVKMSKKSCTKLGQRQTGLVRRPKPLDCRTVNAGREGGQAGRQAGNLGYAVACGSSRSGRQTSWAGALLQLLLPACCCCFPNSL